MTPRLEPLRRRPLLEMRAPKALDLDLKNSAAEGGSLLIPARSIHAFTCANHRPTVAHRVALSCTRLPRYRTVGGRGPYTLEFLARGAWPGPNRQGAVTPLNGHAPWVRPHVRPGACSPTVRILTGGCDNSG